MLRDIIIHFKNIEDEPDIEQILCEEVSKNLFRLMEIPLWAYNLALGDVIKVVSSKIYKGRLTFDDFYSFSENSTIQIVEIIEGGIKKILPTLEKMIGKKNIRFFNNSYIAINVPAEIDYKPLQSFLLEYEKKDIISFKEAALGEKHNNEDIIRSKNE